MFEWPSCCPPKSKDDHLNHLNVLLRIHLWDGPDVPRVRHSENSAIMMGLTARRFPPPWSVEEQSVLCRARPHGRQLAYVYFEDEPGRGSAALVARSRALFLTASICCGMNQ